MLPSLGIRNYRNLKSLDIERLARVNLIAGKNNTGKTSLLEAVSLYAAGGDTEWIFELLSIRDEYQWSERENILRRNIDSYRAIFYQRIFNDTKVEIGDLSKGSRQKLTIRIYEREILDKSTSSHPNPNIVLSIELNDVHAEGSLHQDLSSGIRDSSASSLYMLDKKFQLSTSDFQFVSTSDNLVDSNSSLWSNVALKDEEGWVVEALKIIEPSIVRIAFIDTEFENVHRAIVKTKNQKETLPLQSMGDGMNRILTIILALVNAGDGYLLIDEFENGLHHTVQEDLWKIIFKLAKELNVQVFATTHSDDCIHAFENVLNDGNQDEGQYFRLEKFGEVIKPIFYSASELQIAADQNIETR